MKILVLTTLYPNSQQPRHGIFIENRVLNFKAMFPDTEIRVMAAIPWFPVASGIFGEYAKYAQIPSTEVRHNLTIYHPRYPVIPKIGMNLAPMLMAMALLPKLKQLLQDGFDFDIIDCHYFFPDGVAATWLARKLGKPVTITARGSDIHLIPQYRLPKRMINWALRNCTQAIAVCKALADEMQLLEPNCQGVKVARNGVDLVKFSPEENRDKLRRLLNISGFNLLSVGNLIELKGHHLIIEALTSLPDIHLCIAGNGPLEDSLKKQVKELNLENRVTFLGLLNQQELRDYYAASDALILASSREGWANVLLESMACGTPVIATAIWGTPEVVASDDAGLLIPERSVEHIILTIQQLVDNPPDRSAVRAYAEKFSWQQTSQLLFEIYTQAISVPNQESISKVKTL
ncbi:glycosyltransferase family 4 protein [Paraglaciecola arctica]|uniref:Phosphatidylinositol glycan, class A n=1 Tax=Paraglaciecola arctica BSs20135 TaxID=493475 RepID=K6YK27_9ALTE|nr:glycosyltransferase family 4 protein [Paraglaciecola arctica]GAC18542.1 phosphatidylinositol glycan, class A [Paraglaciecola arctica BSs20135]